MNSEPRIEQQSNRRLMMIGLGILIVIIVVVVGIHFATKSSIENYALSKEYPIYPESTLISKDETCPEFAVSMRCVTVVYCTEDDVGEVVAYLEEQSANVEVAPEALFGPNMFLVKRESTWLDEVMYYVAGEPDGTLEVEMVVGQNEYTVEQYSCGDQTVIRSHVRWTEP